MPAEWGAVEVENGRAKVLAPRNALLVTLAPPYPATDGHRIHLWNLVRALCAEGWATTLISLSESPEAGVPEALRYLCHEVEFVGWRPSTHVSREYGRRIGGLFSLQPFQARRARVPALGAAVRRHLEKREFAAVICDEVYVLPNLSANLRPPVIVDTQHVAHELLRRYVPRVRSFAGRLYLRMEASKMRRWEAQAVARAFAIGAASEREAAVFRQMCPRTQVVSIPNVVDVAEYEPVRAREQEDTILFPATMDWFPNRDAAEFFATSVLQQVRALRPRARFRVAGQCRSAAFRARMEKLPGVEMTGYVEDMRREIERAAVCVAPLRIASGTRLKILEAAAMRRAIVSTAAGAEGLDFMPGTEIVIADDPERMALAIADMLANPDRRRAMGERARRRVERRYSLPVLRAALAATLDPLARPRAIAASGGSRP
ncbi:MAG: glycosyltransferase [Acidobacteriota bacterium]|nr:glycosyltransferase [Acidobacteriota bacterium]